MFIYKLQPVSKQSVDNPSEKVQLLIEEHFNYLKSLHEKGLVTLVGRTECKTFGIALINVEEAPEAFEIMQNDPAVKSRLMKAELFPFKQVLS